MPRLQSERAFSLVWNPGRALLLSNQCSGWTSRTEGWITAVFLKHELTGSLLFPVCFILNNQPASAQHLATATVDLRCTRVWFWKTATTAEVEVWGLNNTDSSSAKIKRKSCSLLQPCPGFSSQCTGGCVQRCRFAKSWITQSAVCNRIQGSNSVRCFCWCHKTQKQNSNEPAESRGWNCSLCVVPRMGHCLANLLQH